MPEDKRPYPIAYTDDDGAWRVPHTVKFSDGTVYDMRTASWRKAEPADPVKGWEKACSHDPLASDQILTAGGNLVREVKRLREELDKTFGPPDDDDF